MLVIWIWFVMLYDFQGLRFLLVLLLCIPLLCLGFLLPQKRGTEVDISGVPAYMTRGETIRLRVKVINRGRLPLAGIRIRGIWQAYGEKKLRFAEMLEGLSGRTEREIEIELSAEHCGQARFMVAKARIYDCLRLFSIPVSRENSRRVLITPKLMPVSESEAEAIMSLLRRSAATEEGDPLVREYRPGDSLRSIHWKLTAKEDELQVRDFEPDRQVSLFLNMTDRLRKNLEQRDAFLDKACSLMAFLAEVCGDQAVVCWMQDGVLYRNRIKEPEDIYFYIHKLILVERTGVTDPRCQADSGILAGCHLEEDGRLYLGDQCVDEE